MNCRTTINTFFLTLLSIQLLRTKWTSNATLYMHYSEKAKGKSVFYRNVFHAQNLLPGLEECPYYFKLNVKMNNFIFDNIKMLINLV